jgi:hypothetical protein
MCALRVISLLTMLTVSCVSVPTGAQQSVQNSVSLALPLHGSTVILCACVVPVVSVGTRPAAANPNASVASHRRESTLLLLNDRRTSTQAASSAVHSLH